MRAVAEGRVQMREVKVKRDELLATVRVNRETHVRDYGEAVAGYKKKALAEVKKAMERMSRRIEELQAGEVLVLQAISFNLEVPENHSKDYDQVIRMLEMSVDETLNIKSDEFACYVMDDWTWKAKFVNTSNMYK